MMISVIVFYCKNYFHLLTIPNTLHYRNLETSHNPIKIGQLTADSI